MGGKDVYVNYADSKTPEAHGSYHDSGQLHFKIGRQYIEWTGSPSGTSEPMRFRQTPPGNVDTSEDFFPIGWEVSRLSSVLPPLNFDADMLVDAQELPANSLLGLYVTVLGISTRSRATISGFPIIATHQFGTGVRAEIEAFLVSYFAEVLGG
jgi:hypothetical protein